MTVSSRSARGNNSSEKKGREKKLTRASIQYAQKVDEISFIKTTQELVYHPTLLPGLFFYTLLAPPISHKNSSSRPTRRRSSLSFFNKKKDNVLQLWIPDTVVYSDSGIPPTWIYSDKDGYIRRTSDFTERQVLDRLGNRRFEHDPVIVCKEPALCTSSTYPGQLISQGNHIRLLSTKELKSMLLKVSTTQKNFCLQKFVKCKGSKAYVCRTVYRRGKPMFAWMISNLVSFEDEREYSIVHRFCTITSKDQSCSFVKLTGRAVDEVNELNDRLQRYIENTLSQSLELLVADYLKDDSGQWWFLQVKCFRFASLAPGESIPLSKRLQKNYTGRIQGDLEGKEDRDNGLGTKNTNYARIHRLIPCKSCQVLYPTSELTYKMTMKMIVDTAQRVKYRQPVDHSLHFYGKTSSASKSLSASPSAPNHLKAKHGANSANGAPLPPSSTRASHQNSKSATNLRALPTGNKPNDSSILYQTWNVCSLCYALYEADKKLMVLQKAFSRSIGMGCDSTNSKSGSLRDALREKLIKRTGPPEGISVSEPDTSSSQDRTDKPRMAFRPRIVNNKGHKLPLEIAEISSLPQHLTLCRFVLFFQALYDVPKEMLTPTLEQRQNETKENCLDVSSHDMWNQVIPTSPPRTTAKALATYKWDFFLRYHILGYTTLVPLRQEALITTPGPNNINRWIPVHVFRTIHFFAPNTSLSARLRDKSGLGMFLAAESSVTIELIRSPDISAALGTSHSSSSIISQIMHTTTVLDTYDRGGQGIDPRMPVIVGSGTISLTQFRSSYVSKTDFYLSLDGSGEKLNLKGNAALERIRVVGLEGLPPNSDLSFCHGVYVPGTNFQASDPFAPEWLESLNSARECMQSITTQKQKQIMKSSSLNTDSSNESDITGSISHGMGESSSDGSILATKELEILLEEQSTIEDQERELEQKQDLLRKEEVLDDGEKVDGNVEGGSKSTSNDAVPFTEKINTTKKEVKRTNDTCDGSSELDSDMEFTNAVRDSLGLKPISKMEGLRSPFSRVRSMAGETVSPRRRRNSVTNELLQPAIWCFTIMLHRTHNLSKIRVERNESYAVRSSKWMAEYSVFGQAKTAVEISKNKRVLTNASASTSTSFSKARGAMGTIGEQNECNTGAGGDSEDCEILFDSTHKQYAMGTLRNFIDYFEKSSQIHVAIFPQVLRSESQNATPDSFSSNEKQQHCFSCDVDVEGLLQYRAIDGTFDLRTFYGDAIPVQSHQFPPYLSASLYLLRVGSITEDLQSSGYVKVHEASHGVTVLKRHSP